METSDKLAPLITAIRHNCDISDADGAAIFSICGMALRLRDLNKWEQGLAPWKENDPGALINWIDQKEQLWETLAGKNFSPLPVQGKAFDPFDTVGINQALAPLNLFYGAGYAHSMKPAFFLARIRKTRQHNGIFVYRLGEELARDLLTIPALNQDGAVVFRQDAARLFLWDQMAYLKKSGQRFLNFALKQCGLKQTGIEDRKTHFDAILAAQAKTYISHEIGEIKETEFDRQLFRELVSAFPHSPVELLARTLKDLLSDTGSQGPLARIIKEKDAAALGFYAAFQDGLFRPLFPQLRPAVEKFVADQDWEGIEQAKTMGFNTARSTVLALAELYGAAKRNNTLDQAAQTINEKLVQPLLN